MSGLSTAREDGGWFSQKLSRDSQDLPVYNFCNRTTPGPMPGQAAARFLDERRARKRRWSRCDRGLSGGFGARFKHRRAFSPPKATPSTRVAEKKTSLVRPRPNVDPKAPGVCVRYRYRVPDLDPTRTPPSPQSVGLTDLAPQDGRAEARLPALLLRGSAKGWAELRGIEEKIWRKEMNRNSSGTLMARQLIDSGAILLEFSGQAGKAAPFALGLPSHQFLGEDGG